MDIYGKAKEIQGEVVEARRYLHENPEIGFDLSETVSYIKARLEDYDIEPVHVPGGGITALIGKPGGKTIMLRADMDALPMGEENDLDFKSKNENAHMCGHHLHSSMLLGPAKILKEKEDQLEGYVKLLFQPAEELLIGGATMVEGGF